MQFVAFLLAGARECCKGSKLYWTWVLSLAAVASVGVVAYLTQLRHGLVVTGMSDQVSWGAYIANFTFLIGMAAAAVLIVIPAYIFHNKHAKTVVLLAEGQAVAACTMALLFVVVDLGHPERFLHMLTHLNWPQSLLAWDVIVLNGYLALNFAIPLVVMYAKYRGRDVNGPWLFAAILLAIFWAISIHTVTAFLYSSNSSRPFWHTALLGPRFLASAFASGPAFMVLAFRVIDERTDFYLPQEVLRFLSIIVAIALQINLFMVGAEVFTEFYAPNQHVASARYLFFGLGENRALVPWIYTALALQVVAVVILMIAPLRERLTLLTIACACTAVGIWIEKGMGLIIPGFIPTPLGEVLEYRPTWVEILVSMGIWALGFLLFTLLAKVALAVELGKIRAGSSSLEPSVAAAIARPFEHPR